MLSLDDLILNLKKIRKKEGNLMVCRIGHYGEANEMYATNIHVAKTTDRVVRKVVNMEPPDISPEPD